MPASWPRRSRGGLGRGRQLQEGREPCLDGAALTIRQVGDDATPLQVADQRAVVLPTAERLFVDSYHGQGLGRPPGAAAHGPQHRVPARRHHRPASEALRRPATEGEGKIMYVGLQPSCPSGVGGRNFRFEPLDEDLRPVFRSDAPEQADADRDDDASAGNWQVRLGAGVPAVYRRRDAITPRTPSRRGFGPSGDSQARSHLDVIDDKAGRDGRSEMKAARHGRISDGRGPDPSILLHKSE